jgi:hypothetical protein
MARSIEKDDKIHETDKITALRYTYKPLFEQAGGWIYFCMKQLRTLKSFQIFITKIKKNKNYD